jgi:hypothetical protein
MQYSHILANKILKFYVLYLNDQITSAFTRLIYNHEVPILPEAQTVPIKTRNNIPVIPSK